MLHFITDAPVFVARSVMQLANGFAEPAPADAPIWADSVVHIHEDDAVHVIHALKDWRIEARKPARPAISDPTFAMAAASIDRQYGGGSSAPTAAFAR